MTAHPDQALLDAYNTWRGRGFDAERLEAEDLITVTAASTVEGYAIKLHVLRVYVSNSPDYPNLDPQDWPGKLLASLLDDFKRSRAAQKVAAPAGDRAADGV